MAKHCAWLTYLTWWLSNNLHHVDAGSCKEMGCGNHDETCWCVSSCWSFNDCCHDFSSACPEKPAEIRLGEVNFLVTTDLHSWIEGRRHQPHLDATLGHVVAALEHLRHDARRQQRDVFFFDNGDINDGTGLSASAEDHVEYLAPVLRTAGYDALNVGNHELYQRNGYGLVPGAACPVVALHESGYIDSWKGRYLTSNVVWAKTLQPIGSRYAMISGEFGTKLLVFGFLYNMEDHCDAVEVLKVEDVMTQSWFLNALDAATEVDAVVVLAHMDYRDDLVDLLWQSIRSRVGASKPIQILAGHSHIRGYRPLDNYASVYEAGCKLDTVGFLSFQHRADGSGLSFDHANITGNIQEMAGAVHVENLPPATDVQKALDVAKEAAGSERILGCSRQHYYLSNPLQENNSLWSFYIEKVIPEILFESKRDSLAIVGTGALSYDIFPGTFTVDDVYKTSPYGNFWLKLQKIPGQHLRQLLVELNGPSHARRCLAQRGARVPSYVSSGVPEASKSYDLIFCDFDQETIVQHLKALMKPGIKINPVLFRPALNTSSVLEAWFQKQSPCDEETHI